MHKCLKDLSVHHCATHELSLNQSTLDLLKSDQRVVIFGHIGSIPAPKTDEEVLIKKDIAKCLYFRSDLIVPTRNPSNLLQSWMHYAVRRSNEVLLSLKDCLDFAKCTGKDISMLGKIHPLGQNIVRCKFNSKGKVIDIKLASVISEVVLNHEDEEYNLMRFVRHLMHNVGGGIAQLNSMGVQLYALTWRDIKKAIREGKKVFVTPPVSSDDRKIIYYDCEDIDLRSRSLLDKEICPGFSEALLKTRVNSSLKNSKKKGCEFDSVNAILRENFPSEWQIYAKSKEKL